MEMPSDLAPASNVRAFSASDLPVIQLAGLPFLVEHTSREIRLPSVWNAFQTHLKEGENSVLRLCLVPDDCPREPGPLLNTSPYFQLYSISGESGFLGRPVGREGWTAWYRPELNRLDLYAGKRAQPGDDAWVDSLLWRFRTFILARHDRAVFHAVAAVKGNRACLFAGDSGSGKSTLGALLSEAGWQVLSDESPIVEMESGGAFRVWGSPWPSSGGFASAGSGPLTAVYCLEHGVENEQIPLTPGSAVKRLLANRLMLCPLYEATTRDRLLNLLDKLALSIPCAVLRFKPDEEIVRLLE